MTDSYLGDEQLSRAWLAAVIESSDDIIVSKTLEGIITSWNPAAERIFGWAAEEAVGKHIRLIIPEERWTEEDDVLARIRRGERVDHFETVRRAKDGRPVDVSITVSPVRDPAGRLVGASKIARDISERRRLEEQRESLLVHEREARRQAEALSNAKDELIATVSHELRTPLNAIFGWARMIQSGELDEAGRARAINTILRNASAQAPLVEDLLDLSRITTGRMRLEFERVNLNAIIEAALESIRPAARAKNIALVTALDHSFTTMEGAPDRLQQVVWNLLSNAVKFPLSGGRVMISSRGEAGAATIVVTDTGQDIAPEALPHIFEAFHQEDSSITRAQGGLGLGLTLVRRLVELHGGTVVAESRGKGCGATFTITLPLLTSSQTAQTSAGHSTEENGRGTLEGTRVLVVDDDAEFLELSGLILRRAGAEVRAVASAAHAYELVNSWLPNVLLTDLAMPGKDGFMLARVLRTTFAERGARVAIIAVTAYGTPESRARGARTGFDLYLTKPVDPVDLAGAVARVIGERP